MPLTIAGIDPVDWSESAESAYNAYGPISYNGALYTWGFTRQLPGSINVFKSTNNGVTWVALTPPTTVSANDSLSSAWYDAAHHKIILMTSDASLANTGIYFIDCVLSGASGSDTFSAPYAKGGPNNGAPEHVRQLSTGDLVVILGDGTANSNRLWAKFSIGSATWGATIAMTTEAQNITFTAAVLDTSDNLYLFWPSTPSGSTVPCKVRNISAAGSLSSITSLAAISMTGAGPIFNGAFWSTNSDINVYFKLLSGGNVFPNRLLGTAASWTNDSISASIGSDFGQIRINGSNQLVAYFIGGASQFNSGIYQSIFNGATWPAPTLIYDSAVNFPSNLTPPIGSGPFMSGITATDAGFVVLMEAHNTVHGQDQPTMVFVGSPAASPPTLACPTTNTGKVGTAFTATLQAAGGSGSYTFSLLSGAAALTAAGLTLNTSTGVISGTPTQGGTFTYTAQVVDSNGLSAQVTCQIIISGAAATIQLRLQGVQRYQVR